MNVSAVNCCKPQPTKSLGFGINIVDGPTTDAPPPVPKKPTFEEQVLLNQQIMIGMIQKIKNNTDKPDYENLGPG